MKHSMPIALSCFLLIFAFKPCFCSEPVKDTAIAFVNSGINFLKANGKVKAFAAFQDTVGAFFKGELYLFAYDTNGVCLAHGQKPDFVGKNRLDVTDANGKKYIQEMIISAKTKGSGWIVYYTHNPKVKKEETKTTYFKYVPEHGLLVACPLLLSR